MATSRVWRLDSLPYGEYLRELADSDLTIAPLADDGFNTFKSQVKFLEAGMLGVPMVASRTLYDRYIEDAVTGLLCDNGSWAAQLSTAVADAGLRDRLAQGARQRVRSWYLDQDPLHQMRSFVGALSVAGRESP